MSSPVVAALLGALAAGLLQTILHFHELRRHRKSVLIALVSEVDAICRLVRHQRYHEEVRAVVEAIDEGGCDGGTIVVDIRSDYFSVFNALSPELGRLEPEHARDIVRFYSYCKSIIDSVRPDGPFANGDGAPQERVENLLSVEALVKTVLELGDAIVQFPSR